MVLQNWTIQCLWHSPNHMLGFLFPVLWSHITTDASSVNLKSSKTVLFHLPLSKKNMKDCDISLMVRWSFKHLLLCIFLTHFEANTKESRPRNKDNMLVSLPVCQWCSLLDATHPKDQRHTKYLWITREKLVPRYNSLLETNIGEIIYPTAISRPVLNKMRILKPNSSLQTLTFFPFQ